MGDGGELEEYGGGGGEERGTEMGYRQSLRCQMLRHSYPQSR